MKAFVRDTYGSPDVLELTDIDCPTLKDDEVLARVRASSLNQGDLDYAGRASGRLVVPSLEPGHRSLN